MIGEQARTFDGTSELPGSPWRDSLGGNPAWLSAAAAPPDPGAPNEPATAVWSAAVATAIALLESGGYDRGIDGSLRDLLEANGLAQRGLVDWGRVQTIVDTPGGRACFDTLSAILPAPENQTK